MRRWIPSLFVTYIQPGFKLQVSMHSEVPTTNQMDESFCVVLVVRREIPKLVPNFTLHSMLIMQPYQYQRQSSTPVQSCHLYKNLTTMQPSIYKPKARPQNIWDLNLFLQPLTQDSPHPITSPSSLSKVPNCLQPTFTRNRSGHCLVTFISVKISFPCYNCNVSPRTVF